MKKKYFIGIDPGRETGVAVWSKHERKLMKLLTLDFWGTINFLETFQSSMQAQDWGSLGVPVSPEEIEFEVVMEDPQLNETTFSRGIEPKLLLKVAQDVGRNKEDAYLIMQWMERKKLTFRTIRPVNKKAGGGKWSAEYFNHLTKWQGKSNEHTRDAARFVFGL